ncbi:hypothetical protein [Chryseobacterium sp. P1-3]|uniref:hypothetical protein n=1 Tax=Chryseobacterium sp. (strain P1-3) TaxID=1517683 RepID=UPI000A6C0C9B|nr:hypothetical protein [Chryseobacterium sp. P1-3]
MDELLNEPGLQITIVLFLLPIIFALILILIRVNRMISDTLKKKELKRIYEYVNHLQPGEISTLEERKKELEFQLSGNELSSNKIVKDPRGLVNQANEIHDIRFLQTKREEGRNIKILDDEKKINPLVSWL